MYSDKIWFYAKLLKGQFTHPPPSWTLTLLNPTSITLDLNQNLHLIELDVLHLSWIILQCCYCYQLPNIQLQNYHTYHNCNTAVFFYHGISWIHDLDSLCQQPTFSSAHYFDSWSDCLNQASHLINPLLLFLFLSFSIHLFLCLCDTNRQITKDTTSTSQKGQSSQYTKPSPTNPRERISKRRSYKPEY